MELGLHSSAHSGEANYTHIHSNRKKKPPLLLIYQQSKPSIAAYFGSGLTGNHGHVSWNMFSLTQKRLSSLNGVVVIR